MSIRLRQWRALLLLGAINNIAISWTVTHGQFWLGLRVCDRNINSVRSSNADD